MSFLLRPHRFPQIWGAGALASVSTISGAGSRATSGTGALASVSTISGVGRIDGKVMGHNVALAAAPATVSGAGSRESYGIGALTSVSTITGVGATSFAPTDITGLALWLDADDIDTLYQDNTKLTAVTSNLDPVGCWADKSGNGYDFVQATSFARPLYYSAGLNSIGTLRGNGSHQLENLTATNWPFLHDGSPHTIIIVFRSNETGNGYRGLFGDSRWESNSTGFSVIVEEISSSDKLIHTISNSVNDVVTATTATGTFPQEAAHIASITYEYSPPYTDDLNLYKNGTLLTTGTSGLVPDTGNSTYAIQLFSVGGDVYESDMDIAEVIVYDSVISSGDHAAAVAYLKAKWGIT